MLVFIYFLLNSKCFQSKSRLESDWYIFNMTVLDHFIKKYLFGSVSFSFFSENSSSCSYQLAFYFCQSLQVTSGSQKNLEVQGKICHSIAHFKRNKKGRKSKNWKRRLEGIPGPLINWQHHFICCLTLNTRWFLTLKTKSLHLKVEQKSTSCHPLA